MPLSRILTRTPCSGGFQINHTTLSRVTREAAADREHRPLKRSVSDGAADHNGFPELLLGPKLLLGPNKSMGRTKIRYRIAPDFEGSFTSVHDSIREA